MESYPRFRVFALKAETKNSARIELDAYDENSDTKIANAFVGGEAFLRFSSHSAGKKKRGSRNYIVDLRGYPLLCRRIDGHKGKWELECSDELCSLRQKSKPSVLMMADKQKPQTTAAKVYQPLREAQEPRTDVLPHPVLATVPIRWDIVAPSSRLFWPCASLTKAFTAEEESIDSFMNLDHIDTIVESFVGLLKQNAERAVRASREWFEISSVPDTPLLAETFGMASERVLFWYYYSSQMNEPLWVSELECEGIRSGNGYT